MIWLEKAVVVLVEGFSSRRGRLKVLEEEIKEEIKKGLPEVKIVVPEYFEGKSYGKIRKYFLRKQTIPEYAERVKRYLVIKIPEVFLGVRGTKIMPIILIGYSMGGLICRYMVEKMGVSAKTVILVGTPNKGINLSRWEELLLKIVRVPAVEDMKENSEFLRTLGIKSMPNYYWLGSDRDKRVPRSSSIPSEIKYNTGGYAGIGGFSTDHSGLIPKSRENIETSAIPAILRILKKEIET